jgi:hypothetical protein
MSCPNVCHHACPAHLHYILTCCEGRWGEGQPPPPESDEFFLVRTSAHSLLTVPYYGPVRWAGLSRKKETEFKKSENSGTPPVYVANCLRPLPTPFFSFDGGGGNKVIPRHSYCLHPPSPRCIVLLPCTHG